MNKNYVLAVSLLLLMSCGNRRPGMSKEEAAAELKKQAAQEEAVRKERAASIDTFAADYRPPAGIKYQAKIVTAGAKTIDVAAALKNVRALKPNELGTPVLYATGVEAMPSPVLLQVENEWVMQAADGLFLLDKDFRLVKQLYRNDVDIKEMAKGYSMNRKAIMASGRHDRQNHLFRAVFSSVKLGNYVTNIPWEDFRKSTKVWSGEDLVSLLPIKRSEDFSVIDNGFFCREPFSSRVYTFGLRGDTLCRFVVNNAKDYKPTKAYRNPEGSNIYYNGGKLRIRMAYDDTVYELEDVSTLRAVWRFDFGGLKRPTGQYVVESVSNSLAGYWLLSRVLETPRYLIIRLSEGQDNASGKKSPTWKDYTLIYDKQTGESFSLPFLKYEDEDAVADFPLEYEGKSFHGFPTSIADGHAYMLYRGKQLKKLFPDVAAVQALKDKEVVVMMLK